MENEKQFFLIGKYGRITSINVEEIIDQDYDIEFDIPVTVSGGSNTAWEIECWDWYSDGGICRLTVNLFSLEAALKLFGEMVQSFHKIADGKGGPFEAGPFIKVEKEEKAYRKSHERQNF